MKRSQGALTDEQRLHELGYAQELRRRMSGFSNFAVSFTIISILSGCLTLYGFGMLTGGPAVIVWGWPFVGIMTLFVGLGDGRGLLQLPHRGWPVLLGGEAGAEERAAWSWFTGWFNFLGQVAVTAGIDFGAAFFVHALLNLVSSASAAAHWHHGAHLRGHPVRARPAEPVRHPAGRAAERRQRVVAHLRRADHRRRAGVRARRTTSRPASSSRHFVQRDRPGVPPATSS